MSGKTTYEPSNAVDVDDSGIQVIIAIDAFMSPICIVLSASRRPAMTNDNDNLDTGCGLSDLRLLRL